MATRTDRKVAEAAEGEGAGAPEAPRKWDHGRVHYDKRGRPTYYIEARRAGRYYLVSTGMHTEREARAEFALFETNPPEYEARHKRQARSAAPVDGPSPILLDDVLVNEFQAWGKAQGLTQAWLTKRRGLLVWWMQQLGERTGRAFANLRGLDKRIILACAPQGMSADGSVKTPSRPHKIATLKALYEWLRNPEQRLAANPEAPTLTAGEDPMIDFSVPQRAPAQSHGEKAPVPREHIRLVLEALGVKHFRDAFVMLVELGWRGEEIRRFGTEGRIEPIPKGEARNGEVASLGKFSLKAGQRRWWYVHVLPHVLAAAEGLKAHGPFDLAKLDKAIRSACKAKGIPPFGYGRLRHTRKAHEKALGVHPAISAQGMGHTVAVADRNYGQLAAAPAGPSLLLDAAG